MIEIGGTVYNTLSNREVTIYLVILGLKAEQNLYTAKLAAILIVIRYLLLDLQRRQIIIFFSN